MSGRIGNPADAALPEGLRAVGRADTGMGRGVAVTSGAGGVVADGRRHLHTRLSEKRRARFLEVLALTSNVRQAALAAVATPGTFYRYRARDPKFAAAWQAALDDGYDAIEADLLARARGGEDGVFDPGLALNVMKMRHAAASGRRGGPPARLAHLPLATVYQVLLRRLATVERRLGATGGAASARDE